MRYDNPQLLDALAREYVLGTLHGRARARFARVVAASLPARRAVLGWERQLAPLASAVPAVEPPPHVWEQIETAIGARAARPTRGAGFWRALAAGLAALAVLFGGLYLGQGPRIEQAQYVSVITDQTTDRSGCCKRSPRSCASTRSTTGPMPAGNSYELWMLPDGGARRSRSA